MDPSDPATCSCGSGRARALCCGLDVAGAMQDTALRLMGRGASAEALAHARAAVRAAPADPQSHVVLAMVLTEASRPHAAAVHYRRAVALSGRRDPIVLANLALALRMQGRMDEGRALYAESHAAAPGEAGILLDWARLEEADHRLDRATELLDRATRLSPAAPGLRPLRATLLARRGETAAALALLHPYAALTGGEWLARGRLLDRAGRYAEAFAAWNAGRAAMRAGGSPQYAEAAAAAQAGRLRAFFTAARLAVLPRATPRLDRPLPVFVLGFPRSGTTLVEQILTATPAIAAGGELPVLPELAIAAPRLLDSPLGYPEALADLWLADRADGLDLLREVYLAGAERSGVPREARLFTDKMPLNEAHLGLIALLFPDAPVIHVVRHPLDVVLSVYSTELTHGFHCASSLESVARHYALTADLTEHYARERISHPAQVRYEALVREPERVVRNLLREVGVAVSPAHLHAHESDRRASTASYAQVAEPIHDRSIERWRHYGSELAPILPILRLAIERLGYRCD